MVFCAANYSRVIKKKKKLFFFICYREFFVYLFLFRFGFCENYFSIINILFVKFPSHYHLQIFSILSCVLVFIFLLDFLCFYHLFMRIFLNPMIVLLNRFRSFFFQSILYGSASRIPFTCITVVINKMVLSRH